MKVVFISDIEELVSMDKVGTFACLINTRSDILDMRGNDQQTAYLYAAEHGSLEFLKMLAESKADIEAVDNRNRTALHLAVRSNNHETAQWLCQNYSAMINAKDTAKGYTPLWVALEGQKTDCIKLLQK